MLAAAFGSSPNLPYSVALPSAFSKYAKEVKEMGVIQGSKKGLYLVIAGCALIAAPGFLLGRREDLGVGFGILLATCILLGVGMFFSAWKQK